MELKRLKILFLKLKLFELGIDNVENFDIINRMKVEVIENIVNNYIYGLNESMVREYPETYYFDEFAGTLELKQKNDRYSMFCTVGWEDYKGVSISVIDHDSGESVDFNIPIEFNGSKVSDTNIIHGTLIPFILMFEGSKNPYSVFFNFKEVYFSNLRLE